MWLLACVEPEADTAVPGVATVADLRQVVPGPGLPSEVAPQPANNNLDLASFAGRTWLAFRTAPDHFASTEAEIHVVSTTDEQSWRYEASWAMGTDLREPRLLVWDGRLFLYFAVLGEDPLAFEPQGMMGTERAEDGSWSTPDWFYGEGFIPWRARVVAGVPYLVTYVGGENIYEADGEPIEVHWLTTEDGLSWEPVVPGQPVMLTGGGSETDFALTPEGALVAVVRNEAGDAESGWGSKICRAEPATLGTWNCVSDPRKFDSPFVFAHGGAIYLLARRNVTESGNYDLFLRDLDPATQTLTYETDYWVHPKRCSLWQVDAESLAVTFLLDLPSRGDTCFPAALPLDGDDWLVYNYSNDVEGPDLSWVEGQHQPTAIYRQVVTLPG